MAAGLLGIGGPALIVIGLLSVVAGALAAMWLFRVREGGLLAAWMSARASAETARLVYFSTIVTAKGGAPSTPPVELLKLEYFRRYQLDMQRTFYRVRREICKRSAERTLMLGGIAVALASVASGAAGISGVFEKDWLALGALGVVGTALSSFASTREAANQDRRNAERYGGTLTALETLYARLDGVRTGAVAGNNVVVEEFVAAVHEQLSLEHRQWLEAGESTRSAIARLDEALKKVEEDRAAKGESAAPAPLPNQ